MVSLKEKKRIGKKNLREVRNILIYMEGLLNAADKEHIELASAFFTMLNYHFEEGDLRPSHVHMAALLRDTS